MDTRRRPGIVNRKLNRHGFGAAPVWVQGWEADYTFTTRGDNIVEADLQYAD